MKKSTKKVLQVAIPIVLAIFLGWYSFSKFPLSEVWPHVKQANVGWILFGVFLGTLSHLSRAYRWKYLLEPLGYKTKMVNNIMAVFAGYLTNFGIPRTGEILRAAILTNYEDVPFEKGFGTIVAERVADVIVMLGIISVTLILQFDFIINLLQKIFTIQKIVIGSLIFLVITILLFVFIRKSKSKIAVKVKKFINGLKEGAFSIFKMEYKWSFIGHTLFIWGMYILMFYVTSLAMPQLSEVTLGVILVAFIAASFSIAVTNGGFIAYPLAIVGAFYLFGIEESPSNAFGWIMWSSQTLMIIVGGIISFIYLPIYNRKLTAI